VEVIEDAKRTRPRLLFDVGQVDAWIEPGVPGPRRHGWIKILRRKQPAGE
jgi:hypothetical protein